MEQRGPCCSAAAAIWDVYLGALREAEIPFAVERRPHLLPAARDLDAAAFVCAVLDPNDQLALLALLRSSAAGVPDAAWLPLFEAQFPALAASLGRDESALATLEPLLCEVAEAIDGSVPGIERVRGWHAAAFACLEAVDALRRSFARDPADVFVERLRAALCFEAAEAARFLGAWRAANLERFFCDLAQSLAAGEPVGALLRRIRRAVAEEETPSAEPTAPGTLDAVTVATLHGAKGLDWDHVYLMQLHKGTARAVPLGEVARVDGELESRWCKVPTLAFDAVRARSASVSEAERVRTLYVGMTRARERLVISGVWPDFLERSGGESHAALLASRAPAPPGWHDVAASAVDGRVAAADACWVIPARRAAPAAVNLSFEFGGADRRRGGADRDRADAPRLALAEQRMALPIGASVTELVAPPPAESKLAAIAGASRSAALWIGTAIHCALESLDLARELAPQWSEQRTRIAAQIAAAAGPGERDAAIADALACWDALAKSPLAARLRGISARVLARELPVLLAPAAGSDRAGPLGFVTGSIDLLYRDDDGRLVVVDYKTDRVDARPDAGDTRERYARQGELYCRAVAEALGADRPPRFEIWWLRSGLDRGAAGATRRGRVGSVTSPSVRAARSPCSRRPIPSTSAASPPQPNTDLEVPDKYTGEVATRVALADARGDRRGDRRSPRPRRAAMARAAAPTSASDVLAHCVRALRGARARSSRMALCIEAGKPIRDCARRGHAPDRHVPHRRRGVGAHRRRGAAARHQPARAQGYTRHVEARADRRRARSSRRSTSRSTSPRTRSRRRSRPAARSCSSRRA